MSGPLYVRLTRRRDTINLSVYTRPPSPFRASHILRVIVALSRNGSVLFVDWYGCRSFLALSLLNDVSTVSDPPTVLYMGKDKFESASLFVLQATYKLNFSVLDDR